jgi:cyclic pyranopterin monophosphate synthase
MSDDPLTHFDEAGAARMVAIEGKPESSRMARARATVRMREETLARIESGAMGKGDVLGVSRIAAIGAAKSTAQLIPLCHPVRLTAVDVQFELRRDLPGVDVTVQINAHDRTGPEMEAMTAAAAAALTIYDMCKAIDRTMTIEQVALLEKSGGKSGHFTRSG